MKKGRTTASKEEKQFMALIKSMPCIACEELGVIKFGVECHHIVSGNRLGNFFCLPLCIFHHRGDGGFSGRESFWNREDETRLQIQLRLLDKVYKKLGQKAPKYEPKQANTSFVRK